ncbi:MAG: translocation/assembly module TamB [Muribaculaceae bacterium]|nr:translocation/assembly module TamB [Muribaculaceae bacterium]
MLYIPFVQDFAVRIATREVSKSTGMTLSVGKLRLSFPLRLRVEDVTVVQANADTMLTAGRLMAGVSVMPLLKGDVVVDHVELDSAFYQMGNRDSLMWLRARVDRGVIADASIGLKSNDISLGRADIDGVRVRMRMLEDTVTAKEESTEGTPFHIKADFIRLSRVNYSMEMLPLIDSLGCEIDMATLRKGVVDMASKRIKGQSLSIDSVSASYIYPAASEAAPVSKDTVAPTSGSEMWTITADTLRLTGRSALYAQKGAVPQKGFDPAYIAASGIAIEVDSFYNRGTSIRVPLRRLEATERCGLPLHAEGFFTMDDSEMKAKDFSIETLRSILRFDAVMGVGDMAADPSLPLSLKSNGRIAPSDIVMAFPDMAAMLSPMKPLSLSTDIDGTTGQLNLYNLEMTMPGLMRLHADGTIDNPFDPARIGGDISIDGSLSTITDREFTFLPIPRVPALQLRGGVDYRPGAVSGDIEVVTSGGRIAADGSWTARTEEYDADLRLDKFPVDVFMPDLGVGDVTARVKVDGKGYNPMARSTSIDADVNIVNVDYNRYPYKNIDLDVALHAGEATGKLQSHNPGADATVDFSALMNGDTVRYDLTGNLRDVNLRTLHLSDSICEGHGTLRSQGFYNVATGGMDVTATLDGLYWRIPGAIIDPGTPIDLALKSEDNGARATLKNGDLDLRFYSRAPLLKFVDSITPAMNEAMAEVDSMRINVRRLNREIPRFALLASMGKDNVAARYLAASSGISFRSLHAGLFNDSLITMGADISHLAVNETRLDSITFNAMQHGDYLVYKLTVNNQPGTFDDFAHVNVNGFAGFNRASVFVSQKNIKDERGFNIGLNASIQDSVVTVRLVPRKPIIAYKTWQLNDSNFISLDLSNKHIDANLRLQSGDSSYISIFTPAHEDEGNLAEGGHHHHETQEDVVVQIANVALQDWLSINPFAPPIKGNLSADMHFRYDEPNLTGKGTLGLSNLYYGPERVGTFDLDVDVANSAGGKLTADVALMVDSVRTVTARGVLNDSTLSSPFLLDFDMIRFPLKVANPFLPPGTASLEGWLNGTMKITGDMANPLFDGYINFDSAGVNVDMLGSEFRFTDEKIPVDSNIVTFDNYAITGCNENPLTINGTVDMRHLTDIRLDLDAKAKDMQIVNSQRARGAEVYGKAFVDLDAGVKGNLQRIVVNADLSLLEGTNVTYVISDAQQALQQQSNEDMVKFVNFSDTTQMASADSIADSSMLMVVNADLHINEGTTVNVDLGGSNKVEIIPSGDLDFSMSPLNGMRMTGRLNINGGYVRYSIPMVLSEKLFEFQEGSYVAFNGNIMNPTLNVHAVDVMRANVTQSGQNSRLVNFDVSVGVTNTLENLNVAFDVSTDDDITVQNELSSMSPEQRANQAMNLLLYGRYSGSDTKASTRLSGNPLFSFLSSQLNNWASKIKAVDISFGIDQYDRTYEGSTSTTTSYSYRVSKSLFNDRFKIVVGGNYSTDANSDENFAQNLINDIAFEYMLNKSGTMYIRIFRHTGYESILEGEITQTGVGFVLRRKLNSLWELLGIKKD